MTNIIESRETGGGGGGGGEGGAVMFVVSWLLNVPTNTQDVSQGRMSSDSCRCCHRQIENVSHGRMFSDNCTCCHRQVEEIQPASCLA